MPEFHKTGAKLFVQLTAGFGRSFTISKLMETLYTNKLLRVISKPFMDLDKITATASPSPNRWSDKVPSREMTKAEIREMIDSFAKSAKLLKDAGVDGVEIHAVHEGYLLDQFTLKYVNHALMNMVVRLKIAIALRLRLCKLSKNYVVMSSLFRFATAFFQKQKTSVVVHFLVKPTMK